MKVRTLLWCFFLLFFVVQPADAQQQQNPPHPAQAQPPAAPPAAGKISGRVLRTDGTPLPKAWVTLVPEARGVEAPSARVDSRGVFELTEVPPGRYRVAAERNGYVRQMYGQRGGGPGLVLTVELGQRLERIDFRLERAGVISGTVTDEDNEPAESLDVRAQRVRFLPGGRLQVSSARTVRTDDLGNFRLAGLAPGYYYVQAGGREGVSIGGSRPPTGFAPVYYPGVALREDAQRIQVTPGGEARRVDIAVRSTPTYSISGVVVDATAGSGPRNYSVGFARGGGMAMLTLDRKDGSFTLRGLEPGEYTLFGMITGETGPTFSGSRRGYRKVTLTDSDVRVVIEIGRTAEVRGELRLAGEGEKTFPFDSLTVNLQPDGDAAVFTAAKPTPEGKLAIRDVPEGQYSFQILGRDQDVYLKEVRCAGEDYLYKQIALSPDQVVEDCELVLGRDVAQVSGIVTSDDKPAPGAVVVLIPAEPQRRRLARHTATAQTDAGGLFQVVGVVPGEYLVFAVPPSDDGAYYDPEFIGRNRQTAITLTVKPGEPHALNLKAIQPR